MCGPGEAREGTTCRPGPELSGLIFQKESLAEVRVLSTSPTYGAFSAVFIKVTIAVIGHHGQTQLGEERLI